jgi:hypothetical protein
MEDTAASLITDLGEAYRNRIRFLRQEMQRSLPDALKEADESRQSEWLLEQARECPAHEFRMSHLQTLMEHDPVEAWSRWRDIKEAALQELRTGYRFSITVEESAPDLWSRARFLALRHDLAAEWQPRNGIERQLIDGIAQAQTMYLRYVDRALNWEDLMDGQCHIESRTRQWDHKETTPPKLSYVETADRMQDLADRWNRIMLRNLRALRDLRRYSGPVMIQNAPGGQVNLAGQQVNVNQG